MEEVENMCVVDDVTASVHLIIIILEEDVLHLLARLEKILLVESLPPVLDHLKDLRQLVVLHVR